MRKNSFYNINKQTLDYIAPCNNEQANQELEHLDNITKELKQEAKTKHRFFKI